MAQSDRALVQHPVPKSSAERRLQIERGLAAKLVQFIEDYNKEAKPFAWTYKEYPS